MSFAMTMTKNRLQIATGKNRLSLPQR